MSMRSVLDLARLYIGSRVGTPLRAWMFVLSLCAVLFWVGRRLGDGLFTRPGVILHVENRLENRVVEARAPTVKNERVDDVQ
jgi:hypothetical protein